MTNKKGYRVSESVLRQIVREEVAKIVMEKQSLNEAMDSEAAYKRLKEIERDHLGTGDFFLLKQFGRDGYAELLDIRDETEDYSDFLKKVGEGAYDPRTGSKKPTNRFNLSAYKTAKDFWDGKTGTLSADELVQIKDEWDRLNKRFKKVVGGKANTIEDEMYGRTRTNVIDTLTGKVVSSTVDREGSLGT